MAKYAEIIDPSALSPEEKQAFTSQLFNVHQQIFSGIDEEEFRHHVVDCPADKTRILVYRDRLHRVVGYCAAHLFEKTIRQKQYGIFRVERGVLRAYRGKCLTALFILYVFFAYKLTHPFKKTFLFGSFTHPFTYAQVAKLLWSIYPNRKHNTPPHVQELIADLVEHYNIPKVNANVGRIGWITKEDTREETYWRSHRNPDVRYFVKQNPGYKHGDGLFIAAPITIPSLFYVMLQAPLPAMRMFYRMHKKFLLAMTTFIVVAWLVAEF